MAAWPVFPEDDVVLKIREVLDSKVGFDFLVYGAIGSVLTVIAGNFPFSWDAPRTLEVASVPAAMALGYGTGWWWTARSGWYAKRERRLLMQCFLAWLEGAVGDPKTKGYEFGVTIVSTARKSGFTLMSDLLVPVADVRSEADDNAAARKIVVLARTHRYRWQRADFRRWASEVTSKADT